MDSTVVAVFEKPQRAEEARRELIAKGIVKEQDAGVVDETSTAMPHGPIQRLKARLGSLPPPRHRGILTVYAGAGAIRQVERLIRGHGPIDVQVHLSDNAAQPSGPPASA
jgi:hypothetical protein